MTDALRATSIEARACGRTFDDGTRALHPTDLRVEAGETLVLLGPSGCGKTTMLRILSGLDRPDEGGAVLFGAEDVTHLPIERRDVGMVFQSYALFPNMSVGGNVAYGPKVKGSNRVDREAIARRYMALTRIDDLAERRVDQLSGGQRQRVALARALAAEPRAIFLDEPLTALDASLRERLRDEIAEVLRRLGITTVYVTHDQAEAMALADRIVVMSRGRIEQEGAPRTIYERPANRFVAIFVGETNVWPDGRLFRPEEARLRDGGRPARVTGTTYLGATTRITATWDGFEGEPIILYVPARDASALGTRIDVAVDEAALMRFE